MTLRTAALTVLALALAACGEQADPRRQGTATPVASRTPAPRLDVPVLCYHQIRPHTAADSAQDRAYIVSPKRFAEQMATLERAGYTTISGDALVAHLERGEPLPRKPVLLTFDDASESQYTRALPILQRHGFKATFFVMTVVLGKPGWLTRGQVRALDRAGMEIGAHTWDHKAVPEYSGDDWIEQLGEPKLELAKIVGHPVDLFAYPFGRWHRKAFPNLERAGYKAAFQLADDADREKPLLTIRRIIVPELSGRELLRAMRREF